MLISSISLVLANAVTLLGVLFWGWSLKEVILISWVENVILGIFNIPKMLFCVAPPRSPLIGRIATTMFFMVHYGMFTFVHGVFIQSLVLPKQSPFGLTELLQEALNLEVALISLVLSHGISFMVNYVGQREYQTVSLPKQMFRPYGRIVAIHVTIILGGGLVHLTGSHVPMLVVLLVLKTVIDLFAHRFEHRDQKGDRVSRKVDDRDPFSE
jgi:hypothetical protein